jgi:DNA-binding NtrC family response regulator
VARPADVRVIAATHRDLAERIRAGAFREDLFYRLNVVRLDLPPLRHRKEDIPLLADHFVARFNRRQGRRVAGLTPDALGLLMMHDFPGNVRELENIIERAFVLCGAGRIDTAHLPAELTGAGQPAPASAAENLASRRRSAEARAIQDALAASGYHRQQAARALGLHPRSLVRTLRALGLELPEGDGRTQRARD